MIFCSCYHNSHGFYWLKLFTYPSRQKIHIDRSEKVNMVVLITKKAFINLAILFFVNVELISGGLFSSGRSKTKEKEVPVRHKRLEVLAKVNDNGKKQKEAFLALVTYSLGFVNTDTQQSPFIERFLIEFKNLKKDYLVSNSNLEKIYHPKDTWCRDFLYDPVLRDNKILYHSDSQARMDRVEKVVHFEYFWKEDETYEMIQCLVYVRNRPVMMYFSTLGASSSENLKFYFALTAYKPGDDSKLTILMRTRFHNRPTDDDEDEDDCYNEYMYDFSQVGQIRLNIKPERFYDRYRLFGKYAEAAFISTNYGFWNPMASPRYLYGFLETAITLSKGYQIRRRSLKTKTVVQEAPNTCRTHINSSRLFETYKIKYDSSKENEITSLREMVTSFIPGIPDKSFRFLKCPVTRGSASGFVFHHPIYFKDNPKASRYDLFWYVASDGEYEGKEVLLLLAPNNEKNVKFK